MTALAPNPYQSPPQVDEPTAPLVAQPTGLATPALCLMVALAAVAMAGTLPGRTHGLGLITEGLLTDLALDRPEFARLNLFATLIGAAFCWPCGWLLDR